MADEQAVLEAYARFIEQDQVMGPMVKAVYTDLPQFAEEQVPAPWVLIQPGTLVESRIAAGEKQMRGYFTIAYFDELSEGSALSVGQIMKNARLFARELRRALHANYTLQTTDPISGIRSGAVVWAGEGDGIIVHYGDAGEVRPVADQPYYMVPIDVDTLCLPDNDVS